jgi:hypothetical protein
MTLSVGLHRLAFPISSLVPLLCKSPPIPSKTRAFPLLLWWSAGEKESNVREGVKLHLIL